MRKLLVLLLILNGCAMTHSARVLEIQRLQEMKIPYTEEEQQNIIINNHEERLKALEKLDDNIITAP